jgi:sugar phosphate isomerase/epimerase
MKISLYTITLNGGYYGGPAVPLLEIFPKAKEWGYDGIDIREPAPTTLSSVCQFLKSVPFGINHLLWTDLILHKYALIPFIFRHLDRDLQLEELDNA